MTSPVSIRMADDLRDRIEALAEGERRSLSNMIIVLVEEALDARETPRRAKRRA